MMTFEEFFEIATKTPPYPYQVRLGTAAELAELIRAPTGAGKTAAAVLGWLWRRHFAAPEVRRMTPRRLIYCLPMRVLVEQTEREANKWIENLGERIAQPKLDISVHVLMGGVEADDWFLHPERSAVLIGTQDMLLSRALNRGYAASRFHWPIDFGLLNNDCLWVFDEPQLMGSGVSTSAQLAGLRSKLTTFGPCPSVWMSATLEPTWLDTVDFAGQRRGAPIELTDEDYDETRPLHKRMTAMKTLRALGASATKEGKEVARRVVAEHERGTQTLVVLNTVDRAKAVYKEIKKDKTAPKDVMLIHSRFRPAERERLNERLREPLSDRIIVATQVVEAGVDLSARTLVTELAPWSSLVQRIGRCNRTGDDGPGRVFWIDLDTEKQASPYEADHLRSARGWLTDLEGEDVSPKALGAFKLGRDITLPFAHNHVLRRRDLLDFFDTAPDLSGNDIDVSRFVRGDQEDRDVQVFWRAGPPDNQWDAVERRRQAARREELCNVPIGSFRDEFLGTGKTAFRFDHLDGEWRKILKKDTGTILPGQVFWVVADQGGYGREIGWFPASGRLPDDLLVALPDRDTKARGRRPEGFYDSDEWSQADWKSIAGHTDDVVRILNAILHPGHSLPITDALRRVLMLAARWHDWGKAHQVFQSGIAEEIDDPREAKSPADQSRPARRPDEWRGCSLVAKAPDEFWRPYTRVVSPADPAARLPVNRERVRRFRHELASALGILALEQAGSTPPDWSSLTLAERLLALYLIASHHGKVRLSLRTMPDESPTPPDPNIRRFAAGIWDDDRLPGADLGGSTVPPDAVLSLEPMLLGGAESWSAGVLKLRDSEGFGPFRLAYLEALLRAADQRASAGEDGTDG